MAASTRAGSVQVEGLNKVVRGLVKAGADVEDLKDTFAGIADRATQYASSFAPVKSGALRNTIRGNRAKNKAVVTAGKSRVKYAGVQNYGWPRRNIQPSLFMQKADAKIAPEALRLLDAGVENAIRKAGLE